MLWRVRTGSLWRDLPEAFGNWNSTFRPVRRWARSGVFESLFSAMSDAPDFDFALIDGTIVSVHQKASGARGAQNQSIGRSRGGLTTKVVALVDALGNLARFVLLLGQAHDLKGAPPLINTLDFDALLADKAFDADWLLTDLDERGAAAVIPPKSNRVVQRFFDKAMHAWRHLVENYCAKIKELRGFATRYDKTDCSYAANWNLVATIIASR